MNPKQFCPKCGEKDALKKINDKLLLCLRCLLEWYQNPIPGVSIVFLDSQNRLLLAKRAFDPGKGKWGLVGGFVDPSETFSQAAVRETKEEINLSIDPDRLIYLRSDFDTYNYKGWHSNTVSISYLYTLSKDEVINIKPMDDVSETVFFKSEDIASLDIAFKSEEEAIWQIAKPLSSQNLEFIRKEIDQIDSEIIKLLAKRQRSVMKVGDIKRDMKIKALQPERWREVISKVIQKADKNNIDEKLVIDIWERIHKHSLDIEK